MSELLFLIRNDRPLPRRNIASRSEVLPEPLPPQTRLRPGGISSTARSMQRTLTRLSSARLIGRWTDSGSVARHSGRDQDAQLLRACCHAGAVVVSPRVGL